MVRCGSVLSFYGAALRLTDKTGTEGAGPVVSGRGVRTPLVQVSSLFALEEQTTAVLPPLPQLNSSRQEDPLEEEAIPRGMEATGELGYEIPSGFSIR